MPWVRLDDHFDEHPKIAALSDAALALWVSSLAYCNRNLTDGFVPSLVGYGKLRYCEGNPTPAIGELEKKGMWEPVEGGWQIHDFDEYQPLKESVLADREGARGRTRVSRERNALRNAERNGVSNGRSDGDVPGTGTGTGSGGLEKIKVPKFDEFWAVYPRKVGKQRARRDFENALRLATATEIIDGAKRYRDDPNREPKYTKHPSTWLNAGCWDDEPEPSSSKPNRALVLAARLEEEGL